MTPDALKHTIIMTLERLNVGGVVATFVDADAGLRRAQEKKVAEAFAGVFGGLSPQELATARRVLDEMNPTYVSTTASMTELPPAAQPSPAPATTKKVVVKKASRR